MQGDPEVLALLNEQLTSELTAVNQYFLHSKLQASWASPSSRRTLAWRVRRADRTAYTCARCCPLAPPTAPPRRVPPDLEQSLRVVAWLEHG